VTPDTKERLLVGLRFKWTAYANMKMHFLLFYIIGEQIVNNVLVHASSINNSLIVSFFFTLLRIACSESKQTPVHMLKQIPREVRLSRFTS
jgi:hypothetical protein